MDGTARMTGELRAQADLPGELGDSISVLPCILAAKIDLAAARTLRPTVDLTPTEWRVIATAGSQPGASPLRVASVAAVDKSVISRAVKSLIGMKLVEAKADPGRSRWTQLFLTRQGERACAIGSKLRASGDNQLFAGFSPDERRLAIELTGRMLNNITHDPEPSSQFSATNGSIPYSPPPGMIRAGVSTSRTPPARRRFRA